MQFPVPQFIEEEDKIFARLSFRQIVYIGGGIGATYVFYRLLPFIFAVFLIIPTLTISFLLALKPINGRPFSVILEAAVKYFISGKLYLWQQEPQETKESYTIAKGNPLLVRKKEQKTITAGKLENLLLSLNTRSAPNKPLPSSQK